MYSHALSRICTPARTCRTYTQGRPVHVRVLHDAQMHHGQNRGKQKIRKSRKKHVNFTKRGGNEKSLGKIKYLPK